jgi:nicotinate phosphoribosyltransferase
MDTSADAPYLDCAYKLVEYAGKARRKRSEGKVLWPGRKQVFRKYDKTGRMAGDLLSLEEDPAEGERLIEPVMRQGRRVGAQESLMEVRQRTLRELDRLPEPLKRLERVGEYPVAVSDALRKLAREVDEAQLRLQSSLQVEGGPTSKPTIISSTERGEV